MKKSFAIRNKEAFETALEIINECDDRYDLSELSQKACDYWEHSKKNRWVHESCASLENIIRDTAADVPEDFEADDFNEQFLTEIGFTEHYQPDFIAWGGNGDVYYFVEWGSEDKSLSQDLEQWCKEQHEQELEAASSRAEYVADIAWDIEAEEALEPGLAQVEAEKFVEWTEGKRAHCPR
jgi:hypothetical protein